MRARIPRTVAAFCRWGSGRCGHHAFDGRPGRHSLARGRRGGVRTSVPPARPTWDDH